MAAPATDRPDPARVLVITAHPDDVDFGAGGTVASWTAAGIDVRYCVITDGQAGGFDATVARDEVPAIRRAEQRAAAELLGVTDVTFLGHTDGALQVSMDLRRDLTRVVRRVRPDRVLCHTPIRNLDLFFASHPDHLAAGEAAMCAVYPDARNRFAHPSLAGEGLEPHTVPEVWLLGDSAPDHAVDVTAFVDRKLAAIEAHASQREPGQDVEQRVRGWLRDNAAAHGLGEGRAAEVFRTVVMA